jgi:putative YhbY family RNA-binding protein
MLLELPSAERRTLRARAHSLKPVVMISKAGLTASVVLEIEKSLASHELIKIRASSAEHATRVLWLNEICATLHAAPVQHIGKILVVYRPLPEEVTVRKSKAAGRGRPARRTKRSFQR